MFDSFRSTSILARAIAGGHIQIDCVNFRAYSDTKNKRVDDATFGGGAGLVMKPQPLFSCLRAQNPTPQDRVIYLSPKGKTLNQQMVVELSQLDRMILVCGHYEGIDQRVIDTFVTDEISIGDYVLTGGELPAMVLIDAVTRMIEGVLNTEASHSEESHYDGLLEYPHYTRPEVFEDLSVPEILMSGHHKNIEMWRFEESVKITGERRPEMLRAYYERMTDKKKRKIIEKYLK
jgi:tRNA (guanine37-N1)-methyltransferase